MPRSITFNGQTLFRPGALSRVQAAPNKRANPSAPGIVALIGEADGGDQGVYEFTDPADIASALVSGDLADAAAYCFDPSNDPIIQGGAQKVVAYKVNQGTAASTTLPGDEAVVTASTAAALSTNTVINYTAGGLTVDAHIGRWLKLGSGATAQYRRITTNAAGTITVGVPFIGDSTSFTGLAATILQNQLTVSARLRGTNGNNLAVEFEAGATTNKYMATISNGTVIEQSPEICGDEYLRLVFTGGPVPTNGTGTVTAATTSSVTIDVAAAPVLNAWANYVLELPLAAGTLRRLITGNTAADPTLVTLTAGYELSTAQVTELAAGGVTATVRAVTAGTASITGTAGAATALASTITMSPVSTADNLSITFSSLGASPTIQMLADYINANTNYDATIPDGINPATLLSEFDFGTNNTSVVVRFDHGIAATDPKNKGGFRRDLQTLVDWINDFSSLCSATRSSVGTGEGAELPAVTGGVYGTVGDVAVPLTGGARGTSANSDWQTGFDALLNYRSAQIVPLLGRDGSSEGYSSTYTFDSVMAQLAAHVRSANGADKNERGAFVFKHNATEAELAAFPGVFNSKDIAVTSERWDVLDINGTLRQVWWGAPVAAAGMRANGLGESLTRKLPRVNNVYRNGWNPASRGTVNNLIAKGAMFTEANAAGIIRWCRDLTSFTNDDAETSIDGQTRDVVRYISYDLRTFIEDTFTGQRVRNGRDGRPPTIASIRDMASARLQTYVDADLLINSADPSDPSKVVPGFDRLRVTLNGSVLSLSARIFPTTAITFETLDITTEIPLLLA